MPKFDLDYTKLDNSLNKKAFKLADVQDKIVRVAFDVVRFKDGNPDELWQIQNADDGSFIVAKYDVDEVKTTPKTASVKNADWQVNASGTSLDIFYKGFPVKKLAGLPQGEVESIARLLPEKLATDKTFSKALLKDLSITERNHLLKMFPELN